MTGQRRGVCVLGAAAVMLRVFVMTVLDEPYLLNAGWLSTLCGGLMGMIALLPCLLEGPSGRGGFETLSGGVGRISALLIVPVLAWLRVNQPDIMTTDAGQKKGFTFYADINNDSSFDISISLMLTERTLVSEVDGARQVKQNPDPPPPEPVPRPR